MAQSRYELNTSTKRTVSTVNYSEKLDYIIDVDNADAGTKVFETSTTDAMPNVSSFKSVCVINESKVPVEIQIAVIAYKDNTDWDDVNSLDQGPGDATTIRYINHLLLHGDFYLLNNSRIVSYAMQQSAANDTVLDNAVPTAARTLDSGFVIDNTTATNNIIGSASNTLLYLDGWTSAAINDANAFHVGDLVRIDNEIMEVTAIGAKAAKVSNTLTVKRGQYGTSAQSSHSDADSVEFPFFNCYYKENKFTTPRTDGDGKFHAFNFFGYGRTTDIASGGIVPGSVAIKFYQPGYQELGLSGITASTSTGLTAGETYYMTITVDGSGAQEVSVTIDASNTNFGGKNGLVQKLQESLNTLYADSSSNLYEERVSVGIVDGDIRFTSQQFLSTSAIALSAGASGSGASVRFFGHATNPTGRIPGLSNINGAVAAVLPADTVKQRGDNVTVKNQNAFMGDDGRGNLMGAGTGRINYETGEIDFKSFPNAEFVINVAYNSALGGGLRVSDEGKNTVHQIFARSVNNKVDAKVKVEVYK